MTVYETSTSVDHPTPATAATAQAVLANKVSWGAIFAGVTIALVTQVVLTLIGAGIGVATLDPASASGPSASTISIGAGIWTVASALVSAFAGGFVAARLSGRTDTTAAALHGLTTWAFTTLLILYLLTTTVGSLVGGAVGGLTSALGGIGRTAIETAAPAVAGSEVNPLDAIESQVRATGTDPEALQANAVNAIRALVMGGEDGADEARTQAAQALAQARGIPVPEAQAQVAEIEERYRQAVATAQETATQAADAAASVVSRGARLAALALVLGAAAGWFGGRSGIAGPTMPSTRRV